MHSWSGQPKNISLYVGFFIKICRPQSLILDPSLIHPKLRELLLHMTLITLYHNLSCLINCHWCIIKWLGNYIPKFIIFCQSSFLAFRRHCTLWRHSRTYNINFWWLLIIFHFKVLQRNFISRYQIINLINSGWCSIPSTFLLCSFNMITFCSIFSPKLCHLRVVGHRCCHPLLGYRFRLLQTKKND